jgi:hypothetical protein
MSIAFKQRNTESVEVPTVTIPLKALKSLRHYSTSAGFCTYQIVSYQLITNENALQSDLGRSRGFVGK